jgi:arginine N-succinyltransferase
MTDLLNGGLRVRPAILDDLDALYQLALMTGGGFTNLPMDRAALAGRLEKSVESFAKAGDAPDGEMYIVALEAVASGAVIGTASLFAQLGTEWPFYSYRVNRISQRSLELDKILTSDVLHLVNDFDGASEVGGLFLEPSWRKGGTGRLLARSRYLFIAQARQRFADRVVADLRGYQAEDGSWPFWDGLGRHFFDMPFEAADRFNSLKGNQFIADLMPKYPIYVRLLPPSAQAAIGRPHRDGEPAYKLLLSEGFIAEGYVDIFDAGPTVHARTDHLRGVGQSQTSKIVAIEPLAEYGVALIAAGRLAQFRATAAPLAAHTDATCRITPETAAALGVDLGDEVRHVAF